MTGTLKVWAGRLGDLGHKVLGPRRGPRVVVTTVPKSGTHLLLSALRQLPGIRVCPEIVLGKLSPARKIRRIERLGPGQVLVGHIVHEPRVGEAIDRGQVKLVVMIRDPRDVVVSLAKYVVRPEIHHRQQDYFARVLKTDEERIMACIRGVGGEHAVDGRETPDVGTLFRSYLAWTAERAAHVCRFEDLVGSRGGGSDAAQVAALGRLFAFLELDLDAVEVERIARATFSSTSLTFRKGEIGDWRNHFSPGHRAAFREVTGPLLVELGYEKGDTW